MLHGFSQRRPDVSLGKLVLAPQPWDGIGRALRTAFPTTNDAALPSMIANSLRKLC